MKTDLQKELDANIPADAVSERQGSKGKSLSYLETWYVIDRLNQVLGQGNWAYSSEVSLVHNGTITTQYGEAYSVHYIARVRLVVSIDGASTEFTDYGYGDGTDKNNPGKAHELAVKEAVSDGLKRVSKNLGRSMGLALYDKTQEFVGYSSTAVDVGTNTNAHENAVKKVVIENIPKKIKISDKTTGENINLETNERPVRELVVKSFKVLEAQKKITKEEFKEKYQKGKGISSLTEEELNTTLKEVRTDFPHLNV